jgi:hypothetical protein
MTTMIHANENGRKRPNLGEQINRLDSMLDGLSDGLNDAVADAVKAAVGDAVRQAVESVLTEVLTNPEIIARLHPAHVPTSAQPITRRASLRERLSGLCTAVRTCLVGLRAACGERLYTARTLIHKDWHSTIEHLAALWAQVQMLRPFRYQILLALAVGTMIGVGVWHAGPWFGAVTSGIGGFTTALSVQAGLWLRKMFAKDAPQMA